MQTAGCCPPQTPGSLFEPGCGPRVGPQAAAWPWGARGKHTAPAGSRRHAQQNNSNHPTCVSCRFGSWLRRVACRSAMRWGPTTRKQTPKTAPAYAILRAAADTQPGVVLARAAHRKRRHTYPELLRACAAASLFSALRLQVAGVMKPPPSPRRRREPVRPERLPPYAAPCKPRGSTAGMAYCLLLPSELSLLPSFSPLWLQSSVLLAIRVTCTNSLPTHASCTARTPTAPFLRVPLEHLRPMPCSLYAPGTWTPIAQP